MKTLLTILATGVLLSLPTMARPAEKLGATATYLAADSNLPASVVKMFTIESGPTTGARGETHRWMRIHATKVNGETFSVWILTTGDPAKSLRTALRSTARYVLQIGDGDAIEFRNARTGTAVLPSHGAWPHLFPRAVDEESERNSFAKTVRYLGFVYRLHTTARLENAVEPPATEVIELLPDLLIGVPSTRKQKDTTRRYDRSDYEYVELTRADYRAMIDAGMTCLRVDAERMPWLERENVFYWGVGGAQVRYPECLYRSNYLGPALFLDEPAVVTRDRLIRPSLKKDAELRKRFTPQHAFDAFRTHFHDAKYEHGPAGLLRDLAARPDVDLGEMQFLQKNMYTWETMPSSGVYQLTEGEGAPPAAIVFEPPGRIGTRRTLPEMNMTYGCQIPADDPNNLASILYGLLRGAARQSGRSWGMSIYGAFDRTDAFWFQTHAYDLGATHFFYWDNYQLACVPFDECLSLTRNLRAHAEGRPRRSLEELKRAAEVLILFPPGYNLGHVDMGKGSLWGIGELNLERRNRSGIKYRDVMRNVFIEIERCLRLGVEFDLLWDLDAMKPSGYRELVRVREDGKVEVVVEGRPELHDSARVPARPGGASPQLAIELSKAEGPAPLQLTARARVVKGSAPVYYTLGADTTGRFRNVQVAWELYGPEDEDYRYLRNEVWDARVSDDGSTSAVEIDLQISLPGSYRLRAATVDLAGRTAVVWTEITVQGGQ